MIHHGAHAADPEARLWGLVLAFWRGERVPVQALTRREVRAVQEMGERRSWWRVGYAGEERRRMA